MIAKITPKSRSFRTTSNYVLKKGRGRIVAGPMAGRTPRELAREFGRLRQLNPKLTKAVAHIILSPAPGDPPFDDDRWQAIAERYATEMGFDVWFAAIHLDTDHQHLHIVACRIGLDGKTISDANDYRRSEAIIRRIEADFGLVLVASPPIKTSKKALSQTRPPTTQGDPSMTDTTPPPNPFDPSDPQHATWPQPFEPNRDLAELAIIGSTASIVVPGAYAPEAITKDQQRDMRRSVVAEDIYSQQVLGIFGEEVTRVFKHAGGATLYFRGMGRIADQGHKLTAMGAMPDELAAARIVRMAVSQPKKWQTIAFTGSDAFVLCAMREARRYRIEIIAVGQTQREILAKVIAEDQGGMQTVAGPAPVRAIEADPILAPLAELDSIPAQTLWSRTAPALAPVVAPPAPLPAPPQPATAPFVGVLPGFLSLRERIRDRRESRAPVKPAQTAPMVPTRRPGSL